MSKNGERRTTFKDASEFLKVFYNWKSKSLTSLSLSLYFSLAHAWFRSYSINKRISPFSLSFFLFFFSYTLEKQNGNQSTAATWRWRQSRLFVVFLLLPFRERSHCDRDRSDRLSFLVGNRTDLDTTLFRKLFADSKWLGSRPVEKGFPPERLRIPSSTISAGDRSQM